MIKTITDNLSIIERLVKFMEYKNLNDNKITSLAGLSIGLIGRAKKKNSGLHSDTIEKILLAFPELNPTWLLTGKGNMIDNVANTKDSIQMKSSLVEDIFKTKKEIVNLIQNRFYK